MLRAVPLRGEQEHYRRLQVVTDAALSHLELDDLLPELLLRVRDVLEVDTCVVLLLDEETLELVTRAAVGIDGAVEQGLRVPLGKGFAGRVAAERTPILLEDVDHADVLNPLLREKGIKTLLGVPLLVAGAPIGVLHVGSLVPRQFDAADVELLQLAADRAAMAIRHVQLVAERVALALEKSRLDEDAIRLDLLKLNFVAIASHELRTPAAAVYGALATLRGRGDALSAEIREQLEETAFEQSDRLRRLIEQLLDLSRLDARSVHIEPRELALHGVLQDVIRATSLLGSDVTLDVDHGLSVVADPLVIDRVVTNLVINARSYGRPPIRIGATQDAEALTIVVEDSGAGIPDELALRLFGRFERGREGHGSGLGLAIAKAYANAHGGELVYNAASRGARFELTLPRG